MENNNHYVINAGDGENMEICKKLKIWRISNKKSSPILAGIMPGDKLWFTKTKTKPSCKVIAVATFVSLVKRETGPLIDITPDNYEIGLKYYDDWQTEIHYTDLYDMTDSRVNFVNCYKSPTNIIKYNPEKHTWFNPIIDYENAKRFLKKQT
jgi:hypothetical protein